MPQLQEICITVENIFGCLKKLRGVISTKCRWAEEEYNDNFRLCVGLTNFHIDYHPFCDKHYNLYKNCNYIIGDKWKGCTKMQGQSKNVINKHQEYLGAVAVWVMGWGEEGMRIWKVCCLKKLCCVVIFFNWIKSFK